PVRFQVVLVVPLHLVSVRDVPPDAQPLLPQPARAAPRVPAFRLELRPDDQERKATVMRGRRALPTIRLLAWIGLLSLAQAEEGFYPLKTAPPRLLAQLGLDPGRIARSAAFVGVLLFKRKTPVTPESASQMKKWFCGTEEAKRIEPSLCAYF